MSFKQLNSYLLFFCCMLASITAVQSQPLLKHPSLCFISDCQEPLIVEKLFLRAHNNKAGREMLFRAIENEKNRTVFMLGDLVGNASDNQAWKSVDSFLVHLRLAGSSVYSVPGNHEYLLKPNAGIANFRKRFPEMSFTGNCVRIDSMAIVLLNSNFGRLSATEKGLQQQWYESIMDSLELEASTRVVILCIHHPPFSNSKVVGSSKEVQEAYIPKFVLSSKAKLLLSGHSHNLEYFEIGKGKHFMVIGGGGGIDQPLYTDSNQKYIDLIAQKDKPRFFYFGLRRDAGNLEVVIRGFSRELLPVPEIRLSL